jgi:hypothetical protein
MGRGVTEKGVRSHVFVPAMNIAGGKARTEMITERKAFGGSSKLGSRLNGLLDTVNGNPAKIGAKELKIGDVSRDIASFNAKVSEETGKRSSHGLDGKLLTTMVDDEVDVIREVTHVITDVIGPQVKVQSMEVVRSIKSKITR